MTDHKLVTPTTVVEFLSYHDIRRQVLFESRGQYGVYNADHPDERSPGNFPKLLMYRGDPIGAVRIDIDATTAIFRRVAIRADVQRQGHGRILLALAEQFAQEKGCTQMASYVVPNAVEFYKKCGFVVEKVRAVSSPVKGAVFMTKVL